MRAVDNDHDIKDGCVRSFSIAYIQQSHLRPATKLNHEHPAKPSDLRQEKLSTISVSPIKNVVLVGASGRLFGPHLLKALQASAQNFNITILTRPSSTTTFPDGLKVIRHNYDDPNLSVVLKELDIHAMVVSVAGTAMGKQFSLIDACAASGTVRRYIPTEFGSDSQNAKVQDLILPYAAAAKSGPISRSWTGVACGMWIDLFLPYDVEKNTAAIWDDGSVGTSYTNIATAATAVVRVLEKEEDTANKYLYIAEMTASQNEIVVALETILGQSFKVEKKSTAEAAEQATKGWEIAIGEWEAAGGEKGTGKAAAFDPAALQMGFAVVMYGPGKESDWKEKNDNEVLGVKTLDVEPFFRELLKKKEESSGEDGIAYIAH